MAQGALSGLTTNQTEQAAIQGHVPAALDLVLAGHLHDFISYEFGPERPAQLIVGTGGDTLLALGRSPIAGAEIDGMAVRQGFASERFGYFIMERGAAARVGRHALCAGRRRHRSLPPRRAGNRLSISRAGTGLNQMFTQFGATTGTPVDWTGYAAVEICRDCLQRPNGPAMLQTPRQAASGRSPTRG